MRAFDLQRALDSLREPAVSALDRAATTKCVAEYKRQARERRTAIENKTDQLVEQFHADRPDPALREDLWHEMERILDLPRGQERQDALEDMTLNDLIRSAMKSRAEAMEKAGLL